jgi:2',3'-cyclic-nucleotide 2'-phosphodiesterase (5'-nucleotidase family)
MTRLTAAIDRRLVLRGLAALPLAAALPRPLRAAAGAEAILVALADLHSPYARLPAVLAGIDALRAEAAGVPVAVLINGDLFERGNAVALRSGAAPDWAFLAALAARGPVVLNLGNHETAIADDLATIVARAEGLGITVIGNVIDRRTGRFFAPVSARLGLGGMTLGVLGLAPTNPFVWRAAVRDTLGLIDPVAFARDAFPAVQAGADAAVLLSHAGVMPDRAILPALKPGALLLGGHDHLDFLHASEAGVPYLHAASWGQRFAVIAVGRGAGAARFGIDLREVTPGGGDAALADVVARALAEHLTDAEREVIGVRAVALDLPGSILLATEAVRAAVGADIALLGHTTFGAPLAAGPVTRYDFDAFIRFDGDIRVATVPGERLAAILTRANQHRATSLDQRTGDYVHAAEIEIDPARSYRVAVNGWTAQNQEAYLGTTDLDFVKVEGAMLKAIVPAALARG